MYRRFSVEDWVSRVRHVFELKHVFHAKGPVVTTLIDKLMAAAVKIIPLGILLMQLVFFVVVAATVLGQHRLRPTRRRRLAGIGRHR